MASIATIFAALLVVAAPAAHAATKYTVGDNAGWTNSGTDYTTWASDKTFAVGDSLVFNYDGTHSVAEVTQSDYNSCSTSNLLKTYQGGSTTISLTKAGPIYFLCPTLGHCGSGMKLAITVVEASSTPATPTTPSPPSSTPGSGTPSTTPPATNTSTPSPPGTNEAASINNVMIGSFVALLGAIVAFL